MIYRNKENRKLEKRKLNDIWKSQKKRKNRFDGSAEELGHSMIFRMEMYSTHLCIICVHLDGNPITSAHHAIVKK
jgi:hypothetical protein